MQNSPDESEEDVGPIELSRALCAGQIEPVDGINLAIEGLARRGVLRRLSKIILGLGT